MNAPTVSIVTVVRNDRSGLSDTMTSISHQIFRDFEWIVVDGGSWDGSVELLESSELEWLEWLSEPDKGIYDAMNKGIEMSAGRYVLFLNAGDRLADARVLEGVAPLIIEALGDERPAPLITGSVNLVLPHGGVVHRPARGSQYMWHSLPTSHQAIFFPSEFVKHNPYDTSYRVCGDYYIAAVAYKHGLEFAEADLPIVNFEVGGYSYQRPIELMKEAMRVQRSVLGMGYPRILLSAMYRVVNMLGLRVLTMVPLARRAGRSARPPLVGAG